MANMAESIAAGSKVLRLEEGRNEEDRGQGEPPREVAAAEGRGGKEFSGNGPSAAGASGHVDEGMYKEDNGAESGQANEQQPNQPTGEDTESKSVQPVPRQVPRFRLRQRFTQWQLEELERIFRINHFISVEARKQLARWMGVTEILVKRWFHKRREQDRRYKRI